MTPSQSVYLILIYSRSILAAIIYHLNLYDISHQYPILSGCLETYCGKIKPNSYLKSPGSESTIAFSLLSPAGSSPLSLGIRGAAGGCFMAFPSRSIHASARRWALFVYEATRQISFLETIQSRSLQKGLSKVCSQARLHLPTDPSVALFQNTTLLFQFSHGTFCQVILSLQL